MDGGYLLLVIGGSGVDQGGVGDPGTPQSGGLGLRIIFMYNMSILGASWGWGWWMPSSNDRHAWH